MYQTVDGNTVIEVVLSDDTVWLTIDKMAELFQRNKSTISRHIKNILESGELSADSTVAFFATTEVARMKADTEYEKFHQRTMYELSPVELHFIEDFEKKQKLLQNSGK